MDVDNDEAAPQASSSSWVCFRRASFGWIIICFPGFCLFGGRQNRVDIFSCYIGYQYRFAMSVGAQNVNVVRESLVRMRAEGHLPAFIFSIENR